jgi:8-oxo-dGTP pyrophosphatase MutT (NUDIX family)
MIKGVLYRTGRGVLRPWLRMRRGITLGVHAAVIDGDNQVLLVRHTYAPGWLLPGGGVERGETVYEAAKREIKEEGGIIATGKLALHGVFSNESNFPGDYLVCFIVREFTSGAWSPSLEIAEARFFPMAALPEGTTGGTRRRIAEIAEGNVITEHW